MPEKSGRAHTEADFVYSLSLDAFKIVSTAIMLLQLLFLTRQSGLEWSWEVQGGSTVGCSCAEMGQESSP